MNCIPKSWVCTLLCSSNSDPDPGAHGKCQVLSEVYLTPVYWTKSSGIGLAPVPRWLSIHRQPGFSGGMWFTSALWLPADSKSGFPAELYTSCSSSAGNFCLELWMIPKGKDLGAGVEEL